MRCLTVVLILALAAAPAFSDLTAEAAAPDFWQEADIIFWQTLPFAALWGHFIDRQVSNYLASGSEPHWGAIIVFGALVSAGNAYLHAQRTDKRLTQEAVDG